MNNTIHREYLLNLLKLIGENISATEENDLKNIESKLGSFKNKDIFLPLEYLIEVFNLSLSERWTLRAVFALESMDCTDNEKEVNSIKQFITSIYCCCRIECVNIFASGNALCASLLSISENNKIESLKLKKRIREFAVDRVYVSPLLFNKAEIYFSGEFNDAFSKREKHYASIFDGLKNAGKKAVIIKSDDVEETKDIIKCYADTDENSVVFFSVLELLNLSLEELKEISLEIKLLGADVALLEESENTQERMEENKALNRICDILMNENTMLFISSHRKILPSYSFFESTAFERIDIMPMNLSQRRECWNYFLKKYDIKICDNEVNEISCRFPFGKSGIISAVVYSASQQQLEKCGYNLIYKGCCSLLKDEKNSKAVRVNSFYNMEDLILPKTSKTLIKEAVNRIKYKNKVYDSWGFDEKLSYGKGLSVVFVGPPGTGKTMGAQVMANELMLELFKVNLAGVVSKYIGETEKNLEDIFKEAGKRQGILFFDEADVLFSKRTEVRESNDKYSNMEAAFLLQKIEEYDGICILATNFIQNFDEAFKRRMQFIIDFPFPDSSYRYLLWKSVFPQKMPIADDIDFDFLSQRFEISGSNIKSAAMSAAFYAAENNEAVSMFHIIKGIKNEYLKLGKNLDKASLREYVHCWDSSDNQ